MYCILHKTIPLKHNTNIGRMWKQLSCNSEELQLEGTLNGGQSFRWTQNKETDEWTGIFSKTVWKLRKQDNKIQYQVIGSLLSNCLEDSKSNSLESNDSIFKELIDSYFRVNVNVRDHYKKWSERDELFKSAGKQFYGIRMLHQEPVENVFSFICSQNNHISRISTMVEKLCTHYGEVICEHDGNTYYSFPEVDRLTDPKVEKNLRDLGFGYRAKFIQKSSSQIVEWGGAKWFKKLKQMQYKDAKAELMKLHGIGPKVADCICLMSLDHLEALPVDTHVFQIAQAYLPHLKKYKSVTDKVYEEIGDHFRDLYGTTAG